MSELRTFLSRRIAEDEVRHHSVLSSRSEAGPSERYWADTGLEECQAKRRILNFHEYASASGDDTAPTAWATLNIVLANMAYPWRHHPDYRQEWSK